MRTTRKEVTTKIREYILQNLGVPSDYGVEGYQDNDHDKLRWLRDDFNRVAIHPNNLRRLGTYDACFVDFLQGLPSAFNYNCWVYQAVDTLESWGLPQPENKDDIDSFDLYNHLITREFKKLLKIHSLDYIRE